MVDQDDGGLPSLEEAAETLGHEAAGPAAADHGDPGVVQQECVVQVVGHLQFTSLSSDSVFRVDSGSSPMSRIPGSGPSNTCCHSTGAKWP